MLKNIYDYDYVNCIRNRVFDKYPDSGKIIFNSKSLISMKIGKYEENLIQISKKYFSLAVENLKDYKKGKTTEDNLIKIFNDFEKEFKITEIKERVDKFYEESKFQLDAIFLIVGEKQINNFQLFTDELSVNKWFDEGYTPSKILLKTDGIQSTKCNYFYIFFP